MERRWFGLRSGLYEKTPIPRYPTPILNYRFGGPFRRTINGGRYYVSGHVITHITDPSLGEHVGPGSLVSEQSFVDGTPPLINVLYTRDEQSFHQLLCQYLWPISTKHFIHVFIYIYIHIYM